MKPVLFLAALLATPIFAQTSDQLLAERLKALVDRKVEELRTELHKEIDALLPARVDLGMTFGPVSREFRELHRIPEGSGLRVRTTELVPSNREALFLMVGDVVLKFGGELIGSPRDIEGVLARDRDVFSTDLPSAEVIRKGERTRAYVVTPAFRVPMAPPETAGQMADRMWENALKNAGLAGTVEIPPKPAVTESRPAQNSLIPGQGGRR